MTNSAGLAALRRINVTQKEMAQVQGQASSGLRVAGASDNAAYWSIGVTMRSQVGVLSAVKDGLALSGSIAAVTGSALTAIVEQMNGIKNDLVAASQPGVSAEDIDLDVKARQQQIITIANAASFNGENWLAGRQKTDEVIHDVVTYDHAKAYVQGVLNRTSATTSSFDETVSSTSESTITAADGTTQTVSSGTQHTETHTLTVTVNPPGPATKVSSEVLGPVSSTGGSGATAAVQGSITLVQSYQPGQGLSVATLSDKDLRLFTNNEGQVRETSESRYTDQTVDNNLAAYGSSEVLLNTSQATSYNSNMSSAPSGLLDQSLTLSNATGAGKVSLLNMTVIGATGNDLATMLSATDAGLQSLIKAAAVVGGLTDRIQVQSAFEGALSDALTSGVGSLTDADMNTVSTRIRALETQQQLQVQALSIANQDTQVILKLFG